MTDPRYTDPRYNDPPNTNLSGDRSSTAMWGWIAGIAVIVLIAFILAAGWNGGNNTASNQPTATVGSGSATQAVPPATTGSAPRAPATTPQTPSPGSGAK